MVRTNFLILDFEFRNDVFVLLLSFFFLGSHFFDLRKLHFQHLKGLLMTFFFALTPFILTFLMTLPQIVQLSLFLLQKLVSHLFNCDFHLKILLLFQSFQSTNFLRFELWTLQQIVLPMHGLVLFEFFFYLLDLRGDVRSHFCYRISPQACHQSDDR